MMLALKKLDPASRLLITLVYLEGLNYGQIAKKFGEPENTLRVKLYRILKSLKESIKRQIALSTASIQTHPDENR